MNRLNEIEARLAEINAELGGENADLDSLEAEIKSLKEERATLEEALKRTQELRASVAEGSITTTTIRSNDTMETKSFAVNSAEYREAWLCRLQGKELTPEQRAGLTSDTSSVGYAIPTLVADKIIENLVKTAPMLGEIDVMHIPSNVNITVENTVADPALHTENADITSATDTVTKISLTGYEICKVIDISAKVAAMAIDAFETWIVNALTRKLAEVIENYIINGTGSSQPKGIEKAETWTDGTNAVDWASTTPTTAEIIEQIGYLNGAYAPNAKFLVNWKTFWDKIFSLRDDKKEPVVKIENGNYFIFGFPVLFSAKVADDTIYFGDYFEGVKANFVQDINIESSAIAGFGTNSTKYRGACIFDCQAVTGRIIKSAATIGD